MLCHAPHNSHSPLTNPTILPACCNLIPILTSPATRRAGGRAGGKLHRYKLSYCLLLYYTNLYSVPRHPAITDGPALHSYVCSDALVVFFLFFSLVPRRGWLRAPCSSVHRTRRPSKYPAVPYCYDNIFLTQKGEYCRRTRLGFPLSSTPTLSPFVVFFSMSRRV